jgi:hypothetical protein
MNCKRSFCSHSKADSRWFLNIDEAPRILVVATNVRNADWFLDQPRIASRNNAQRESSNVSPLLRPDFPSRGLGPPEVFNLRMGPYGHADVTSNT